LAALSPTLPTQATPRRIMEHGGQRVEYSHGARCMHGGEIPVKYFMQEHHPLHGERRYVQDENVYYEQQQPQQQAQQRSIPFGAIADSMAKQIVHERDALRQRVEDLDGVAQRALAERDAAAEMGRRADEAARKLAHERDEFEDEATFARELLSDAAQKNAALVARCRHLEGCLQRLLESAPEVQGKTDFTTPPADVGDGTAIGLARTREAIVKAVNEAAALRPDERRKKLRQLRLKWHPDKHEVLKEMAEEVTKMINEAIDAIGGEDCGEHSEGDVVAAPTTAPVHAPVAATLP